MDHPVVSREQWLAERKQLLAREKELTRLHDQVARGARALPWVRIDKDYGFDTPEGQRHLVLARVVDQRVEDGELHRRDLVVAGLFHEDGHGDLVRAPDQVAGRLLEVEALGHRSSVASEAPASTIAARADDMYA